MRYLVSSASGRVHGGAGDDDDDDFRPTSSRLSILEKMVMIKVANLLSVCQYGATCWLVLAPKHLFSTKYIRHRCGMKITHYPSFTLYKKHKQGLILSLRDTKTTPINVNHSH